MNTRDWVLTTVKDGKPCKRNDIVFTKAGEAYILHNWQAPQHEASTGRVYCTRGTEVTYSTLATSYFPTVFQLAFIRKETK